MKYVQTDFKPTIECIDPFNIQEKRFIFKAEHYMRYTWAASQLKSYQAENVWDVSCGTGYGSYILSQDFDYVCGLDNNQKFIEVSDAYVAMMKNLTILPADIEKQRFDHLVQHYHLTPPQAVVSFETIEHLTLPEVFVKQVFQLLPESGVFICSMPNSDNEKKKDGHAANEYHEQLFTTEEAITMLMDAGFSVERHFSQPISHQLLRRMPTLAKWLNKYADLTNPQHQSIARLVATPIPYFVESGYSNIFVCRKG